jgi:hypothetical protein
MQEIPLYFGKGAKAPVIAHALVDDDDLALVGPFRWHLREFVRHAKTYRYATTNVPRGDGTYNQVSMHRLVLGIAEDRMFDADHRDGNGLNNQRSNLRPCTHAQNMQNRRQYARASRFRGVQQLPSGRWRARYGGKQVHIGTFDTDVDAARAAEAFRRIHAPFAEPDPALAAIGET